MPHDVFICHSTQDKPTVDATVAHLEAVGIRCWVAPRDVVGDWGDAIAEAIQSASLVVLVFSKSANESRVVRSEVTLALSEGLTIVPFRLDGAKPTGAMLLHLSAPHWLDATTPVTSPNLDNLVDSVRRNLQRRGGYASTQPAVVAAETGPRAGDVRTHPKDGLRYVWIPPGNFLMGRAQGYESERPAHKVEITEGFWIGQTPVTVGAYKRFARATGKDMPYDPEFSRQLLGAMLNDSSPEAILEGLKPSWIHNKVPITMVNWFEAMEYSEWLGMRLPTEAEWEYSARAGAMQEQYGDLDSIAWYGDNSGASRLNSAVLWQGDPTGYADWLKANGNRCHPVRRKNPNAFGLHDVLGNVWEWVLDWYSEAYYKESPAKNPPGPLGGEGRVIRGGSWFDRPELIRLGYRGRSLPTQGSELVGFRCAGTTLVA